MNKDRVFLSLSVRIKNCRIKPVSKKISFLQNISRSCVKKKSKPGRPKKEKLYEQMDIDTDNQTLDKFILKQN